MADLDFSISLPGVDVQNAQIIEKSLDSILPVTKIDSQANPSHYITLEFYFSTDLPDLDPAHDENTTFVYDYMIEPTPYVRACWAYYEEVYGDGFGPLPQTIDLVTSNSGASLSYAQEKDRVVITFNKFSRSSDPGNYDFTGKLFYVHLYIFEEEVSTEPYN